MGIQTKVTVVIAVIAAVVIVSVSAGYAWDYYGTTASSGSKTAEVKYVVVEMDNNTSSVLHNTFHFSGPGYYADTSVPGSTTYRTIDYSETSQAVQVRITGANTDSVTMKVALVQTLPSGTTAKLQFYNSNQSATVGPEVVLSTTESTVTTLTLDTIYYCKVTVESEGQINLSSPPSAFDLDITFTAFAETS